MGRKAGSSKASKPIPAGNECYRREVALEGLEGITLASFWIRLQEAFRYYHNETVDVQNAAFQQAAWEELLADQELSVYLLPEARSIIPELEYKKVEDFTNADLPEEVSVESAFKRPFSAVDADDDEVDITLKSSSNDGHEVTIFTYGWEAKEVPSSFLNCYGIFFEKSPEILGSCRCLHTRTDISHTLRKSKPSLSVVREQYGDRLVIVASDKLRKKALGIDKLDAADLRKVTPGAYAVLELVGRHRHYGVFLVLRGWTILGRGIQTLKQVHNYTGILRDLNLISKKKLRFDIQMAYMAYTYITCAFLKHFDRPVNTKSEEWFAQVQHLINSAPAPGYPIVLLPRLEAYEHVPDQYQMRRRIRRILPDMKHKTFTKSELMDKYPQLEGDLDAKFVVTYVDPEVEKSKATPLVIEPYVVPEDLKLVHKPTRKQAMLAVLSLLKANRERGLSEPEIRAIFVQHGVGKRRANPTLGYCLDTGYVIRSGRFGTRNKPKRYVLVSSEEERQQISKKLTKDEPETMEDATVALATSTSDKTLTNPVIIGEAAVAALKLKLLQAAEKMLYFPDANYFLRLVRFFHPDPPKISPAEFHAWLQTEINKGSFTVDIIATSNQLLQLVSTGPENIEEQTVLVVHSSVDRGKIIHYGKRLAFTNVLQTALGPFKDIKRALELCKIAPGKYSCHEIYSRERITRVRLLHRYLIQLTYQRSDSESARERPFWARKCENFEFCGSYPGWVTMEEIVYQMPLAVFVRLVPLQMPSEADKQFVFTSVADSTISSLPMHLQDLRIITHTLESRHFVYVLRDLLDLLQCFGFVREGPKDLMYPDGTELYYVSNHITVPDTKNVLDSQINNGVLNEELINTLPERTFEFHCDEDVITFWQIIQQESLTKNWRRLKTEDVPTANEGLHRLRVDELKKRFGSAVALAYPDTLTTVFRPPGDRLSIFGFDSMLKLNERLFWKRRMVLAHHNQCHPTYIADLDDFPYVQTNVTIYRGENLPQQTPKRLKVVTGGIKVKPGPKFVRKSVKKSPVKAGAAEIHRLFQPSNWGSLFHNERPWCRGEELVAVAYLAIRDLITRFKRKPVYVEMLVDLLTTYFPDAAFRRSMLECDVILHRIGRLPKAINEMLVVQDMARRMVNFEAFLEFVNQTRKDILSMRELFDAWREMVVQVLNKIFQSPPYPRRKLLHTSSSTSIRSVINESETARQFTMENLVMQALHTESTIDNRLLEILEKQPQRIMVGVATYLSYRGILAYRKGISNKLTPHLMVTVGTKSMGLSMRFTEKYRNVQGTLVADNIRPSVCVEMCDPNAENSAFGFLCISIPLYNSWRLCMDVFQLTGLGSSFWARLQAETEDEFTMGALIDPAQYRIKRAAWALEGITCQLREALEIRFKPWIAEQERSITLPRSEEELFVYVKKYFADDDLEFARLVLAEVKSHRCSGTTKKELYQIMDIEHQWSCSLVHDVLQRLIMAGCIVEAGCDSVRYVSALCAAPWVQEKTSSSKREVYVPYPWTKLDGNINGEVLINHLRWILQLICEQHVTSLEAVITQFQPYFLPRTILEIVKILCVLGLIKKTRRVLTEPPRYLDISAENEWMDDGSLNFIFLSCRVSAFESLMSLSILEELFGLQPTAVFPALTEMDFADVGVSQTVEPDRILPDDEDVDMEEPVSQDSIESVDTQGEHESDDDASEEEDDAVAFMDAMGLQGSRWLLDNSTDESDVEDDDDDSLDNEVGTGTGHGEAELENMDED
ncbi:uncharacterized protein LOC129580780 [Paramacrobiotus metropolitanus]|uniref:uncharacterized protein LOC129580780 n=1 Tax=Paramacrobiotus metropolitanus TaxID=2943436 RepID=UPI002445EAD0|nr:uncharacterized protein LOC129580780 [Paramacrobiotus metropolitanus]